MDDAPVDIRGAKLSAGVLIRQLFMVQSQQVQQGRVQVVHVDFPVNGKVPDFIGVTVGKARTKPATGQKHGKATGIMIASVGSL